MLGLMSAVHVDFCLKGDITCLFHLRLKEISENRLKYIYTNLK